MAQNSSSPLPTEQGGRRELRTSSQLNLDSNSIHCKFQGRRLKNRSKNRPLTWRYRK